MIALPRSLVRSVRLVFSRALAITACSRQPPVEFRADGDRLAVRAQGDQAAVAYTQPADFPRVSFVVPLEALKNCEGTKSDPVTFDRNGDGQVVIKWQDGDNPQTVTHSSETREFTFPPMPGQMAANEPELLDALRDAVDTADKDAKRYAFNCLQLRPNPPERNTAQIAATDSRQLLVQSGFAFPWTEDVLIPASPVFGSREFRGEQPVEIGKSEDWVTIRIGNWTVHLRIENDARFPRFEDLIPNAAASQVTLQVSEADAKFLTKAVGRLPAAREDNFPVTIDLNGQVAIRANDDDHATPVELVLAESNFQGQPNRFNTNRKLLARALTLGFREVHLNGPEDPAYCRDDRRSYVWALLGKQGIIKSQANMSRIEPPAREQAASKTNERKTHTMPKARNPNNAHTADAASQEESANTASLLEQAESLKGTLTEAMSQTKELISSLKRQQKQTRLMQSTLQSLKQLQSLGG